MARKKPIISPLGQWAYPGEVTIIPSNSITMKGVNYPVLGIDDLGNSQMMMPGQNYTFPGDYVTEIPQMQFGGMSKRKIDKILNQNKDLNFVQRMYQSNTPSIMIPGQQHPSTHFMESADGRVYPTVVQIPDGSLQYLGDNAYDYANQTGQYIEFPNDRQARKFAKSYKKGTGVLEEFGKGGLAQWFDEKWVDVKTGKACGRSGKDKNSRPYPACRPSKRVNETTPKTASELSSSEKAKFKREKTSGQRISYNHSRKEDGGETGWLEEYQAGGVRRPIYTSNPRDPRIGRYADSLNLYNKNTLAAYNLIKKYPDLRLPKVKNTFEGERIEVGPYGVDRYMGNKLDFYGDFEILPGGLSKVTKSNIKPIGYQQVIEGGADNDYFPVYKKPVQPYIYKKPVAPRVIPKPVAPRVIPKPVTVLPVIPPPIASVPVVEPAIKNINYVKPVIQQFNYMSSENKAKALQKYGSVSDMPFQGVDINQLKNGGWLNQYQDGGWAGWTPNVGKPYIRTSPAGNAGYTDNTRVVNQNTNVSAANRKAAEAAEYAKRVGSVSQGRAKSAYEKAREASSLVAQAEQRKGSADPLDYVLDMVNPAFLPFAGIDLVGNTAMGVNNLAKGNFSEAAGNALDAGFNALDVIPAAAELRGPLRSMIRSRGVRPDFTPNVSNQLAPPPSEIIVDPTTGQFNSYFNDNIERPYFNQLMRDFNRTSTDADISNLFANPAESIDLRKLKKIAKNRSGLTKEDVLKNASPKDREALSKMSESEFEQTVLKPTGEVVSYEPAINLGLGFNTNTRNLNLSNTIPMDNSEYVDIFNSRLDRLNEIISRNNKSGLDYSVKGLSPSGVLTFNNPAQIEKLPVSDKVINELKKRGLIDSEGNMSSSAQEYVDRWTNRNIPQGESTWMLDINPGQWRGEVEDIANSEYFKAIPGLNMRNTTASVFSDALPRRGTGTYNSINEYLKELDLGRVKPGFNSQSQSSSGLWEDAIKKGKAFGYFNNPGTVYGSMRTISPLVAGAAAASQLPEQKNGGWLDTYQDGGENLPELNSKIDIANFYKNPLSEKYGIYQDPTDKGYKYYLKSGDEGNILESGPDLSNISSRRLAEINFQKGSLSDLQLANIKNVSPVILPEQKQRILRDKVYYDQEDLMEQAMSESPISSVKTPSYSEILESDPEFKKVMTEKPKPVAPIKPKPVATNTPLVSIGNAPRAIVKPAVRKVVAKNDIVNLADFTFTAADRSYLNKVEEYCPKGNCLETTRNAYDMTAGRIQGIPTSSDIWSNDLKVHSKKGTPTANDVKQYPYFAGDYGAGTVDSWDIHGVIVANGGKNLFNINNPTPIDYKKIPVGAVIGWGPANKKDSSYSGRSKGYNKQFGMQPSHHSTMVTGYSETGEPIVYDGFLKKYMTLTEAKANIGSSLSYELENISAPNSVLNNTQDNLRDQGILLNYIPPTNVNPNKILAAANQPWAQIEGRAPRFNKQMMTEFNSALMNNKGELMRNLNMSSEKYDDLAKIALAISAQESEGGGGLSFIDRTTVGMTQLNTDNIYKDDKLKKAASKPYMLNDGDNNILSPSLIQKSPSASAVASMIYLSQLEKSAQAKYNEGKVPKDRSFTKNSNIIKDALRSNTSKYNADGFFVEEANKRIDLSPFEGGMLSSPNPVAAQKLLNKTAGVADKYKVSVKNGSLIITMKTKGNADLTYPEIIGYGWQSLNTLKDGDAQGDSVHNKRIKNYYDLLNNTTPTYRKEGGETDWLNKYK